jgi:hypothetical protein
MLLNVADKIRSNPIGCHLLLATQSNTKQQIVKISLAEDMPEVICSYKSIEP